MKNSKKASKMLSVHKQIDRNNKAMIGVIALIVTLGLMNLLLIDWYQNRLHTFNMQADATGEVEIAHYVWLNNFQNGNEVELDPDQCSFAKWYTDRSTLKEEDVADELKSAYETHRLMHETAQKMLATADETQKQESNDILQSSAQKMLTALGAIKDTYHDWAEKNQANLLSRII